MKKIKLAMLAVTVAFGAAGAPAGAAVITKAYVTTASFTGAPITSVSLSYTLTYDPAAVSPSGTISNFAANPTAGPFTGPVGAEFVSGTFSGKGVVIGNSTSGIGGMYQGTDDFVAQFSYDASGSPIADTTAVYFTRSGGAGLFASKTATTVSSVVPEPATWGLMLLGFGAVGAVARRRRTDVAFA